MKQWQKKEEEEEKKYGCVDMRMWVTYATNNMDLFCVKNLLTFVFFVTLDASEWQYYCFNVNMIILVPF